MKAKLRVVGGRANRQEIVLSLPTIVGRAKESGLCVRHPTVSRKHCELREEGGLLVVEDLGSSNGIAVGDRVVPRATLQPGDRLTIGPLTFEAQYQVNGVSRAPAPPSAGVPLLADTEVESDFDFLSDDAPAAAESPAPDAASELPAGQALELGDEFELAPLDGEPAAQAPTASAAAEEVADEFALPDEIPLELDALESVEELSDAAGPPNSAAESGLKLHETLEFELEDEPEAEPAAAQPREAELRKSAAPEKASGEGETLDGLDDWLGLSDE